MSAVVKRQYMLHVGAGVPSKKLTYTRGGYYNYSSSQSRFGNASINRYVTRLDLISAIRSRLLSFSKQSKLQLLDVTINGDTYCLNMTEASTSDDSFPNTISTEYRHAKLFSVLAALTVNNCNGKGRFSKCTCPRIVTSEKNTCTNCVAVLREVNSSINKNKDSKDNKDKKDNIGVRIRIGPLTCSCVYCVKYRGEWNADDETCACPKNIIQHPPLDFCSNCLCLLAVEEYLDFADRDKEEYLHLSEQIRRELFHRERMLVHTLRLTARFTPEWFNVRTQIFKTRSVLAALIPSNASDGCDSNRRINACKCYTDKEQVCDYCKHQAGSYFSHSTNRVERMLCTCAKCCPVDCRCECNSSKRGLRYLCVMCLLRLWEDYSIGKRVCFCEKNNILKHCGSDNCPNPSEF
jgi:hypothetical protein